MSFRESCNNVNFTVILKMDAESMGFTVKKLSSQKLIYVVKSVSSELCTISTTPVAMQIMVDDEIRGVSLYSSAKSDFFSIEVSDLLEIPVIQGVMLKLDLCRAPPTSKGAVIHNSNDTVEGKVRSLAKSDEASTIKSSLDTKDTSGNRFIEDAHITEEGFEEKKDYLKAPIITSSSPENLRVEVQRLKRELQKCVPKTKLQESERKCEELRKQLGDANQKLRAADVANQRLMSKSKTKNGPPLRHRESCDTFEDSHCMVEQVAKYEAQLGMNNSKLQASLKEIEELKNQLLIAQTALASLEEQLIACSNERDEGKTRIALLEKQLVVHSIQREGEKVRFVGVDAGVIDWRADYLSAELQVRESVGVLHTMGDCLRLRERELKETKESLKSTQKQLRDSQEMVDVLYVTEDLLEQREKEREELRVSLESSQRQLSEMQKKFDWLVALESSLKVLGEELEEMRASLESRERQLSEKMSLLSMMEESLRHRDRELEEMRGTLESSERQLSKNVSLLSMMEESLRQRDRELEETKVCLESTQEKLLASEESFKHRDKELQEMKTSFESSEKRLRDTQERIGGVLIAKQSAYRDMEDLRGSLDSSEKQLSEKLSLLSMMEESLEQRDRELDEMRASLVSSERQLSEKMSLLSMMEEALRQRDKEFEETKANLEKSMLDAAKSAEVYQCFRLKELESVSQSCALEVSELRTALSLAEDMIIDRDKEMCKLRDELAALRSAIDSRSSPNFPHTVPCDGTSSAAMCPECNSLRNQLSKSLRQNEEIQVKFAVSEQLASDRDKLISEFRVTITELASKLSETSLSLVDVSGRLNCEQKVNIDLEAMHMASCHAVKALESREAERTERIEGLESQLVALQTSYEDANSAIAALRTTVKEKETVLSAALAKISALEALQLDSFRVQGELEAELRIKSQSYSDLQHDLSSADKTIAELSSKVKESRQSTMDLRNEREGLLTSIKELTTDRDGLVSELRVMISQLESRLSETTLSLVDVSDRLSCAQKANIDLEILYSASFQMVKVLESQEAEMTERIEGLESQLVALQTSYEDANSAIAALRTTVKEKETVLSAALAKISALEALQLDSFRVQGELEAELRIKSQSYSDLQRDLSSADTIILELRTKLQLSESRPSTLDFRSEREGLLTSIQDLELLLSKSQRTVVEYEELVATLKVTNKELEVHVAELKSAAADAELSLSEALRRNEEMREEMDIAVLQAGRQGSESCNKMSSLKEEIISAKTDLQSQVPRELLMEAEKRGAELHRQVAEMRRSLDSSDASLARLSKEKAESEQRLMQCQRTIEELRLVESEGEKRCNELHRDSSYLKVVNDDSMNTIKELFSTKWALEASLAEVKAQLEASEALQKESARELEQARNSLNSKCVEFDKLLLSKNNTEMELAALRLEMQRSNKSIEVGESALEMTLPDCKVFDVEHQCNVTLRSCRPSKGALQESSTELQEQFDRSEVEWKKRYSRLEVELESTKGLLAGSNEVIAVVTAEKERLANYLQHFQPESSTSVVELNKSNSVDLESNEKLLYSECSKNDVISSKKSVIEVESLRAEILSLTSTLSIARQCLIGKELKTCNMEWPTDREALETEFSGYMQLRKSSEMSLIQKLSESESKCQGLEVQLTEERQAWERLNDDLNKTSEDTKRCLEAQMLELQRRHEDQLSALKAELQVENEATESKYREVVQKLLETEERAALVNEDRFVLARVKVGLETQLSVAEIALEDVRRELAKALDDSEASQRSLHARFDMTKSTLETTAEALAETVEGKSTLYRELSAANSIIDQLKLACRESEAKCAALETAAQQCKTDWEIKYEKLEGRLLEEAQALQRDLSVTKAVLDDTAEALAIMNAAKESLETEKIQLLTVKLTLEASLNDRENQLKTAKDELEAALRTAQEQQQQQASSALAILMVHKMEMENMERLLETIKDAAGDANRAWEGRYTALELRSSQALLEWEEKHRQLEGRLAEETAFLRAQLVDKSKECEESFARESELLNQLDVANVLMADRTVEWERRFADLEQRSTIAMLEGETRAVDLEKQLQDSKLALQEVRVECFRVADVNENLQSDLQRANARLSSLTEALATSRQETSSISAENGSLAAELKEARDSLKDHDVLESQLEESFEILTSTKNAFESEAKMWKARFEGFKSTLETTTEALAETVEGKSTLYRELSAANSIIDQLKLACRESEAKCAALEAAAQQCKTDWESKYEKLEGRLLEEAQALQRDLSVTKAVLDDTAEALAIMNAAKESLESDLQSFEVASREKTEELSGRLFDAEESKLQLSMMNADWERQFVELEQASTASKEALQARYSFVQTELSGARTTLQDTNAELAMTKKVKCEVEAQLRDRITGLEHQIEDMEDALKSAMEEAEAKFNEVSQLLSATKQSLDVTDSERNELLTAKSNLQALLDDNAGRYEESLVCESELRRQLDLANAVLADTMAKVEQLRDATMTLQEQENSIVDLSIKLEETERYLQVTKDAAGDANRAWEGRYTALELRSSQALLEWEEKHRQLEGRLAEEAAVLRAQLVDKSKECEESFARESELLNQLDVANVLMADSMEECKLLQVTTLEWERRFADLEQRSTIAMLERETRAVDLEKQLQDSKLALQEVRVECFRVAGVNENLQSDLQRANARLSSLTEALATSRQETSSISAENGSLAAELKETRDALEKVKREKDKACRAWEESFEEFKSRFEHTELSLESTRVALEKMTILKTNIEAEYSEFRLRSEKTMDEMIHANQAEIKASGERCADLQRQLNDLDALHCSFRQKFEKSEAAWTETQEQLKGSRAYIADVDDRVEELVRLNNKLLTTNEKLKVRVDYLSNVEHEMKNTDQYLENTRVALEKMTADRVNIELEYNEFRLRSEKIMDETTRANQAEIKASGERCADLQRRLNELREIRTSLNDQLEAAEEALTETKEQLKAARAGKAEAEGRVQDLTHKNSKLLSSNENLEDSAEQLSKCKKRLEDTEDKLAEANYLLEASVPRSELSSSEARCQDLRKQMVGLKVMLDDTMKALARNSDCEDKLNAAKKAIQSRVPKEQYMEIESKCEELTQQMQDWQGLCKSLQSQLKEKDELLSKNTARSDELHFQLINAQKHLDELIEVSEELRTVSTQFRQSEQQNEKYADDLVSAKDTIDEMNKTISLLTYSNRSQESAYNQLNLELKDANVRITQLQNRCEELEHHLRNTDLTLYSMQGRNAELEDDLNVAKHRMKLAAIKGRCVPDFKAISEVEDRCAELQRRLNDVRDISATQGKEDEW